MSCTAGHRAVEFTIPDQSGQGGPGHARCPPDLRQLRRARDVRDQALEKDIRAWIAFWNEEPEPFIRAKTSDVILGALALYCRQITDSDTRSIGMARTGIKEHSSKVRLMRASWPR